MSSSIALTPVLLVCKALIYNSSNEILMLKRSITNKAARKQWETPGGKVDRGQTIKESLTREIHEETGLAIDEFNENPHVQSRLIQDGLYKGILLVTITYKALSNTKAVSLSNEHTEYQWLPKQKVLSLDLRLESHNAIIALMK